MTDLAADSLNQSVVDYADVADLYELCACRKEQTMRVCRSHEALRRERDELLSRVIEAHDLIISRGESTDVPLQFSQHGWLNSVSARYWDSATDNWRTVG